MADDRVEDALAATVPGAGDGATVADDATLSDATLPDDGTIADGAGGAADGAARPTRVGRYQIEAEIGAGAMGVVYRARDPELDRVLAIKLVTTRRGATSRDRLLREAQAMAKVRHPNVVPIFDVGAYGDGIFVVMPLISGGTLRAWMRAQPRSWKDVVERLTAAGRGLAAAHAAGLVHRDFKPDNVLVGDDGEVMVADFGLALATIDDTAISADGAPAPTPAIETSSIAGTPAYMAPEQRAGAALDARTDQFAFCVAFWEGLFGERPGDAATRTLVRGPFASRSTLAADAKRAPAWLAAALERGLAADPARRWPSIAALLDHVRARRQRPRRVAFAAIALPAVAAIAVTTWAMTGTPDAVDPCASAGARVAEVWTPARRAAIAKAFAGIDAPYAASVAKYVDDQFERAATAVTVASKNACEATKKRGEQSDKLLDARMACLDRHLENFDALSDRLTHADRAMLDRAASAVSGIDDVTACTRVTELSALPPQSTDKVAQEKLRAAQKLIAATDAEQSLSPSAAIVSHAKEAVSAARAAGYCPVLAHALLTEGEILLDAAEDQGGIQAARAVLLDTVTTADSCSADYNRAVALLRLAESARLAGESNTKTAAAFAAAASAAARSQDSNLRISVALSRADQAASDGDMAGAAALAGQALDLIRASEYPHNPGALQQIASILADHGETQRAEVLASEAHEEARRQYGTSHPVIASTASVLATIRMLRGDNKGAVELLEEVLQIQRGAYGPENRQVLIAIVNLAAARATLGMHDQARHDLIAILPAIEHVFGKDHPLEAAALDGLVVASEGQPEEAIAYGRRAVAITIASEGVDSPTTAGRRQNLAGALTHAHQYPEAVALLRLALATFDHQTATDAVERLQVRLDLGGALLATKQPREARPLLDQARAGFAKAGDAANVAACDLALADADLAQHARVAAEARIDAVLAAHPDDKDASRAHALAWRAAHPR